MEMENFFDTLDRAPESKNLTTIAKDIREFIFEEKHFAKELNYNFNNIGIAIDKNSYPFAFTKKKEEEDVEETDTILFKPGTLDRIPEIEEIEKLLISKQIPA